MAQITYRANLSAKSFPFISENYGRSVIVPGQDQNYVRTAFSSEDLDKDKGTPQIYYCHNVMPHQEGLQSIGFKPVQAGIGYGVNPFTAIYLIRDFADNKAYLGVAIDSNAIYAYIADGNGGGWVYKTGANVPNAQLTVAYVAGVTYIYIAYVGCFKYDFQTAQFQAVTLAGLTVSNVAGICAASGYMIAWSKGTPGVTKSGVLVLGSTQVNIDTLGLGIGMVVSAPSIPSSSTIVGIGVGAIFLDQAALATATETLVFAPLSSVVAWSSTVDPTDFVPSAITGAGGGPLEAAKGAINYCVPHTLGFIIGTADNCIAAIYQNNQLFPFQYRELVNSGGMTSLDLVTWDANSAGLYCYTTSGLQLINTQQTQTVLTEITDFISGSYFEDFDDATKTFTRTELTAPMQKKLSVVADRYLVVSYGISSLTHAIVYDLITKRYGKLKGDHVQCFTIAPTTGIAEIPRQSIGFLRVDGSVYRVDFDIASKDLQGTVILGKYQYIRARMMTLDTIAVETFRSQQTCNLTVLTALDGKNTVQTTPYLSYDGGSTREYSCRETGINHSLLFQGGFLLNSLVLQFHIHGKR